MKWSQIWNTLQICPHRDSNSGGSDLWSNALSVGPQRRPEIERCYQMISCLTEVMYPFPPFGWYVATLPHITRLWWHRMRICLQNLHRTYSAFLCVFIVLITMLTPSFGSHLRMHANSYSAIIINIMPFPHNRYRIFYHFLIQTNPCDISTAFCSVTKNGACARYRCYFTQTLLCHVVCST